MEYKYSKVVSMDVGIQYHLDIGNVSDEEYDTLKPIIEHLGGHWREKYKCFVFGEDVKETLEYYLHNGVTVTERYKWQEETQFYPTPKNVAEHLVELAEIKEGNSVLEPSAGTGNLLDPISVKCDILAIEPLMENSDVLRRKGYNHSVCTFEEFKEHTTQEFDRVVMNPPFSGQRDIKHVLMAYDMLKPGGILVGIISENALYYQTELSEGFRKFLKNHKGIVESVPSRSFEESGTTIEVVIVKLVKE